MDGTPNAVSPQVANHGKTIAADFALDGASNIGNTEPGTRHQHCLGKGTLRAGNQALRFL